VIAIAGITYGEDVVVCRINRHERDSAFPQNGRKQLVETMRMAVKHFDLRGVPNYFKIDKRRIRMIVSLLFVEDRQVGWIVSLEEVGE
jgi:hypothetical protein